MTTPTEPDILSLLARPVAFHPAFVKLTGSVDAAIMLSQAFYWLPRTKKGDGWFYKTRDQWQAETALSRSAQETARKHLRKCPFWKEERRGSPAQMYYRLDRDLLNTALIQMAGIQPTGDGEVSANKMAEIQPTPRARPLNSSESTTESTQALARRGVKQAPPGNPEPLLEPPYRGKPFIEALALFDAVQKEEKRVMGPTRRRALFEKLAVWPEDVATYELKRAAENGWKGVFREKTNGNGHQKPQDDYRGPVKEKPESIADRIIRENCPRCNGTCVEVIRGRGARPCKHEPVSGVAA